MPAPVPAEPGDGMEISRVPSGYWARMFGDGHGGGERVAAVYACVYVIASTIAAMPLQLYRRDGEKRSRERRHPLAMLLDDAPNGAMTWTQLREAMLYQVVLRGNAYTRNFWKGGHVGEVFPVTEGAVRLKLTEARRMAYEIGENAAKIPTGMFFAPEMAHYKGMSGDGLEGISPIEHCRQTMRAALAITEHGTTTAEKGAPIRGIVTNAPVMKNDEAAKNTRQRFRDAVGEAAKGEGVVVMEGDLKFTPVSMSMRDAQFIESMRFSVEEITRIFNVPPHKIQSLERATFNNIEHLSREFYTSALLPWITRLEATMNATLLTKGDRAAGLYLRHNADGLLRGDLASRSESYSKLISCGVLTPNEARGLEDREPIEGGDSAFVPVNIAPLKHAAESRPDPENPPKDPDPPTKKPDPKP